MIPLPPPVADLCAALGGQRGVVLHWTAEARQGQYEVGERRWRAHAEFSLAHARASLHDWFTRIPAEPDPLVEWVSGLRGALTA